MHAAHRWDEHFFPCVEVHTCGRSQIRLTVGKGARARAAAVVTGSAVVGSEAAGSAAAVEAGAGGQAGLEPSSGTTTCRR